MTVQSLLTAVLVILFALPTHSQVRFRSDVDALLKAASKALEHYQQLAPAIRCETAEKKSLRDSCKITVEALARDVQDAKNKIGLYRSLATPRVEDLFDIYESFERIMGEISQLGYAADLYGASNSRLFAEAHNNFVKVTMWFGVEVRNEIRSTHQTDDACPPA